MKLLTTFEATQAGKNLFDLLFGDFFILGILPDDHLMPPLSFLALHLSKPPLDVTHLLRQCLRLGLESLKLLL